MLLLSVFLNCRHFYAVNHFTKVNSLRNNHYFFSLIFVCTRMVSFYHNNFDLLFTQFYLLPNTYLERGALFTAWDSLWPFSALRRWSPFWPSCSGVTPLWAASWAVPKPSRPSLPASLSACGSPTLESQPWRPMVSSTPDSKKTTQFVQFLWFLPSTASRYRCPHHSTLPPYLKCTIGWYNLVSSLVVLVPHSLVPNKLIFVSLYLITVLI